MRSRPAYVLLLVCVLPVWSLATHPARAATLSWTSESDIASAHYGTSCAVAGDVNGDGYSDVIVGAPDANSGGGMARVYLGGPNGLAASPAWTFNGAAGSSFGYSVAPAGDVNGDGYDDVLVGAPNYANGQAQEGRVYLFLGGPSGLSATPAWTYESNVAGAQLGFSVATAGDVNGDGFPDVIVGAPGYTTGTGAVGAAFVFTGSALGLAGTPFWSATGTQAGAHYGWAVSGAGDLNGDGYADVVVGVPDFTLGISQPDAGKTLVYSGGSGGLTLTQTLVPGTGGAGSGFGRAVGPAGDVNGDGYADLVVGAPLYSGVGITNAGMVKVYLGSAGGVSTTAYAISLGYQAGELYGCAVGTLGDVTGDGFADVAVGAQGLSISGLTHNGGVYLFYGGPAATLAAPDAAIYGDLDGSNFGTAVLAAGDVNGDGFGDLIAGAPNATNGQMSEGRAYVYLGGPPAAAGVVAILAGSQSSQQFGFAMAAADVNGDGYSDLVVGSPQFTGNFPNEGVVSLYLGSAGGLAPTTWSVRGGSQSAQFGYSVADAGDVNGDGYEDILVAEPYAFSARGQVVLYLGSASGLQASPAWSQSGEALLDAFGYSVAGVGDVNGDGYADVVVGAPGHSGSTGRAYLYLGGPSGLSNAPQLVLDGNAGGDNLGTSVAGAGDINADGFSDFIVGAPYADATHGVVRLYLGGEHGPGSTPAWSATGVAGSQFGASICAAGDLNGDGYSDIAIGAPLESAGALSQAGAVYVFDGSPAGLPAGANATLRGALALEHFGASVACGGDPTASGYSGLLVGAPLYSGVQANDGAVFLYPGSAGGVSPVPSLVSEGAEAGAHLGAALAGRADFNGDGLDDFAGGAPVYVTQGIAAGGLFEFFGGAEASGQPLLAGQIRSGLSGPIAALGHSDQPTVFGVTTRSRSVMGRDRVGLEYEVAGLRAPFGAPVRVGMFDTGTPVAGGYLSISTTVVGLSPAMPYHWRLRVVTRSPYSPHGIWASLPANAATETDIYTAGAFTAVPAATVAPKLTLAPPRPNPSTGPLAIRFALPRAGHARLAVYDLAGRRVATLEDGDLAAGEHAASWDGRDASGRLVPAGVWYVRLEAGGAAMTRRIVRVR